MKYERGSFITVPSRETLRGINPIAQSLYMWLCAYSNETGQCFPSRKTLAADVGCSEATIDRMIAILIERELLKKKHQKTAEGDMGSNLYTVLIVGGGLTVSTPSPHTASTVPSQVRTNSIKRTQSYEVVADATPEKKVTPQMREVFALFSDNPARAAWPLRIHERKSAQILFDTYDIDVLSAMLVKAKKYKNEILCPQINSPAELLEKIPKFEKFLKDLQRV